MTFTVILIALAAMAALAFCFIQFIDLMGRSDDEFPGRFDKPIWAAAILLANVFGAFAFFICKPRTAPQSGSTLRAELAAVTKAPQQGLGDAAIAG